MTLSSKRKLFAFFLVLFVPLAFFLYFEFKKQETGVRLKKFPVLSQEAIPSFSFYTHNGDIITRDSIRGKIVISDFFFTTCRGICPVMSDNMQQLQEFISTHPNLKSDYQLISHTVDPETDDVSTLNAYAEAYGADPEWWVLVTGEKKEIYDLATGFYKLPALQIQKDTLEPFVHSERFVLLDKTGYIRGYYDGTDSNSVKQLMKDIVMLDIDYEIKEAKEAKEKGV